MDDASLALAAFQTRSLLAPSDVPGDSTINLAAAALMASGWTIYFWEISAAVYVVAAGV